MIKAIVLIPLRLNDGTLVPVGTVIEFYARVFALSPSGHTRRPGASGSWRDDDGSVFTDDLTEFIFALPSWRDVSAFLSLVDWARVEMQQEAMYIEVMGVPEVLGPNV